MSFLSHIGATAYKYEVEVVVVSMKRGAIYSNPVYLEWKRGSSVVKTNPVAGEKGSYDFGKKSLKITSTLFKKKDKFQKKESRFTLREVVKGKETVIGVIDFDLSNYVKTSDVSESLSLALQKSSDKMAFLNFRINTHWLKGAEINSDDEMSRSTNFSTIGGSNESSLNESPSNPSSSAAGKLDALDKSDEDDDDSEKRDEVDSDEDLRGKKKGSAASSKPAVNKKKQASSDDEDEDEEDETDRRAKLRKKAQADEDSDEDDSDEEDAKRKVKFSKKNMGRSSREGSLDTLPKKSNLKGAAGGPSSTTTTPSKTPISSPNSRPEEFDQSEGEHDEDGVDLFGVTMDSIMRDQKDSFPDLDVPIIVDVLLRGIEKSGGFTTEGIFRVSPINKQRDELRAQFERGEYQLPKDPNVSAALLKYWFAELSEPFFPSRLLPSIMDLGKLTPLDPLAKPQLDDDDDDEPLSDSDEEDRRRRRKKKAAAAAAAGNSGPVYDPQITDGLKAIISKLPTLNQRVLVKLLQFLNKICLPANSSKNRMSPQSLAVVFAPNLIRAPMPDMTKKNAAETAAADAKRSVNFIQHCIHYSTIIEGICNGEPVAATKSEKASASSSKKPAAAAAGSDDEDEDHSKPKSFTGGLSGSEEDEDDEPKSKAQLKKEAEEKAAAEEKKKKAAAEEEEKKKKAAAAAAAAKKRDESEEDGSEEEEDTKKPAPKKPSAAASKQPVRLGKNGKPVPADDSDDSDEEDSKRKELFKKKGIADSSSPSSSNSPKDTASITNELFAKKGSKDTAPAASPKAAAKLAASPSPTASSSSSSSSSSAAAAKKKPVVNDSDDSDDDRAPRRKGEAEPAEAPASQSLKDMLFAKKNGTMPTPSKDKDAAKDTKSGKDVDTKKKPASAKSTFGESEDEETEEEEEEEPPRGKKPLPPQAAPSPTAARKEKEAKEKEAAAATAAAAAAVVNSKSSSSSSSAEVAALKAQIEELLHEKEAYESHITELEDELEQGGGGEAVTKLEKENKRLKEENKELQRSNSQQTPNNTSTPTAAYIELQHEFEEAQHHWEEERNEFKAKLEAKDAQIRTQQDKIDMLQLEIDKSNLSSSKKGKNASSDEALDKANQRVKDLAAELSQMSLLLKDTRVELQQKENEMQELRESVATVASPRKKKGDDSVLAAQVKILDELKETHEKKERLLAESIEQLQAKVRHLESLQNSRSPMSGDDNDYLAAPSPQFDRTPSFGVKQDTAGFGIGDINSPSHASPRSNGKFPPPSPPPPPPPVSMAAVAANESILSSLQADLRSFLSSHDSDALQAQVTEMEIAVKEKEERINELLRELKRKDDEMETLLSTQTKSTQELIDSGAVTESKEGEDGVVSISTIVPELEPIDWPSLTERQRTRKIAAIEKMLHQSRTESVIALVRQRQLDKEMDEIVEMQKARKAELKSIKSELNAKSARLEKVEKNLSTYESLSDKIQQLLQKLPALSASTPSALNSHSRSDSTSLQRELDEQKDLLEQVQEELEASQRSCKQLEKENQRVSKEVKELQRTLESSSSGSSSKQVDSLKKQISSLLSEKDELSAEIEEMESKFNEQRKTITDLKKTNKNQAAELEEIKEQLAISEANARSRGGSSSTSTPAKSPSRSSSKGANGLDEEKFREESSVLQMRFDEVRTELEEKLATERKLTRSLTNQIQAARLESEQLRARELAFNNLNVIPSHLDPKKNAKDKLQMDLISAFEESQKRVNFLTQQLQEVEFTLVAAKQGWQMTIQLLQDQLTAHEAEITELKTAAEEALNSQPIDSQAYLLVEKKLRKSEAARAKMQELLQSLENEIAKKKSELKTALQSIIDLQTDNAKLKEELVRSGVALKTIADDNFELKEFLRLNTKGAKK